MGVRRIDDATRQAVLALYDVPDPSSNGRLVPGYDRDHAERTTRIVMRMARELGLDPKWRRDLEVTALLHDIGRVGMDPQLFGRIFMLAQELGLPVRVKELRARYPHLSEGQAAEFFVGLARPTLERRGIPVDARTIDHVRMRMDFKGRLRQALREKEADLRRLGVAIKPWMEKVMLYYYYPDEVVWERPEVRLMAMTLVACENFEAYNNRRRGRDYYGRPKERLRDVFATLERFREEGLVSAAVLDALRRLTASGALDAIIKESRGLASGAPLPDEDVAFQQELKAAGA